MIRLKNVCQQPQSYLNDHKRAELKSTALPCLVYIISGHSTTTDQIQTFSLHFKEDSHLPK